MTERYSNTDPRETPHVFDELEEFSLDDAPPDMALGMAAADRTARDPASPPSSAGPVSDTVGDASPLPRPARLSC